MFSSKFCITFAPKFNIKQCKDNKLLRHGRKNIIKISPDNDGETVLMELSRNDVHQIFVALVAYLHQFRGHEMPRVERLANQFGIDIVELKGNITNPFHFNDNEN